jgi:putative SOS response-associated peptidase YedK
VVRNLGAERELTIMRWGMPPPPKFGGAPVTNIRNTWSALARLVEAEKPLPCAG